MFNKHNSKLLAAETPLQVPRRSTMDKVNEISLETPLADYKRLIENMLKASLVGCAFKRPKKADDDLIFNFTISNCKRDYPHSKRRQLRGDGRKNIANAMITEIAVLIKRKYTYYFDDMSDPEPADFYRQAGAVPAWEAEKNVQNENSVSTDNAISNIPIVVPTTSAASITPSTEYKISTENPLENYKTLGRINLTEKTTSSDEQLEAIYSAIAECARKTVWSLLFE